MKAISIRQPWAWAIMTVGKDIENRDWSTNFRGRVAIHASAGMTKIELEDARHFIFDACKPMVVVPPPEKESYALGAIVGTVEINGCVRSSQSPWFVGDYGFVLRDPVRLAKPIPCKGALGFWNVPKDLHFQICERCGRSRDGHSRAMLMHEAGACEQFQGEYDA